MTIWKKAISVTASAALLASLLATAAVATVSAACVNGPYGTAYPYCTDVTERPADGTSYIQLAFTGFVAPPGPAITLTNISVTGGQFIGGAGQFGAGTTFSWPRTQVLLSPSTIPTQTGIAATDVLFLASNTAGTASVTISYSTGTTVYDSTQSFTFTGASINTPSVALSSSKLYKAGVSVSSPASATKATGDSLFYMGALVKDNNGAFIASGVTVEWTIAGPAFFECGTGTATDPALGAAACGVPTSTYKATSATFATTGLATSPRIFGTGAGGTATVSSVIKYLGVSYALPDKVINFVGDPATITCANAYYSLATGAKQPTPSAALDPDDGAIECNVKDANGFNITSGVIFTATNPTPAAFWTPNADDMWSTKYTDWEVGVACGDTAGTNSANIKATVGTKSVTTTDTISMTCATALTDADRGALSVDTSAGTTVQPGGQLAINVIVKDKNGLPAPDGTVITAATNGFGTIVRTTIASNAKGTVNGISKFVYLAPSTPGTAVVTFFGGNVTTPNNVAVTIGVGQAASQAIPVTVKAGTPTSGGTYGTATPVVARGTYISWRGVGGASYAGTKVYIWVAKKGSDGTWSAFSLLTSRVADASGTVYFNWKSAGAAWWSVRFGNADMTSASVARQGRWK